MPFREPEDHPRQGRRAPAPDGEGRRQGREGCARDRRHGPRDRCRADPGHIDRHERQLHAHPPGAYGRSHARSVVHRLRQKYLEENGYEITSSEFVRIPNDVKEVTPEQRESIEKLIEKLEEDEDVQNVFHNMKEDENGDEE